ncbi:WG repeat-containing protein [Aureibaculum algae]|uniref:WG repeat-containing protein n=1 Tax=Aureibaculum algae TaxID=2584122 RepID=A0A5B7TT61_9FLAO|nr:WG repeat-containing protein [Aureibaculum algae]QCX38423.1 WG repeat-containing protein [Aureibaculum algae]
MKHILSIIALLTLSNTILAQDFELIPYRIENKWGFCDSTKKIIIEPKFQDVIPFNKGYAAVKENNKWGFIDLDGKETIKPKYDSISNYFQKFFIGGDFDSPIYKTGIKVYENTKSFYVDINGIQFENEPEVFDVVSDELDDEIKIVEKNGKYGVENTLFDRTLEPKYDSIKVTKIGIIAKLNEKFGVIDLNKLTIKIPLDYKSIEPTEDNQGYYVTNDKDKIGYFDKKGNKKIAPEYKVLVKLLNSNLGFKFSKNSKIYGYINVENETPKIIDPKYLTINTFVKGYSKVKTKDGKYGYINSLGSEYFEK